MIIRMIDEILRSLPKLGTFILHINDTLDISPSLCCILLLCLLLRLPLVFYVGGVREEGWWRGEEEEGRRQQIKEGHNGNVSCPGETCTTINTSGNRRAPISIYPRLVCQSIDRSVGRSV